MSPLFYGDRGPVIGDPASYHAPFIDHGHFYLVGHNRFGLGPVFVLALLKDGHAVNWTRYAQGYVQAPDDPGPQAFAAVERANSERFRLPYDPDTFADTSPNPKMDDYKTFADWRDVVPIGSTWTVTPQALWSYRGRQPIRTLKKGDGASCQHVYTIVDFPMLGGSMYCYVNTQLHIGYIAGRLGMRTGGDPVAEIVQSVVRLAVAAGAAVQGNIIACAQQVMAVIETWFAYARRDADAAAAGDQWGKAVESVAHRMGIEVPDGYRASAPASPMLRSANAARILTRAPSAQRRLALHDANSLRHVEHAGAAIGGLGLLAAAALLA